MPGGGAQTAAEAELRKGGGIPGKGVAPAALLLATHVPHPIAAPAALEGRVEASRRGRPERAVPAPYALAYMLPLSHGVDGLASKLCRPETNKALRDWRHG